MNLLLTFDNDYAQHACVVLASFCSNNDGEHWIYVVSDYLSKSNKERFAIMSNKFHFHITFLIIDKNLVRDFPIGKKTANNYINIAAYYRLFVNEMLPTNISKILYLDCDTVINNNLTCLWNKKENKQNCIFAVEDSPVNIKKNCNRLQYPIEESYFNSGVFLINLQEARKYLNKIIANEYIKSHHIIYHDQDVLNGIFHDKKTFIDVKYNLLDIYLVKNAPIPDRYKDQISDAIKNPYIVHFSGPLKPWHKECKNPYKHLYYKYLNMTPWCDYKPVYKYNTFKERALYLAKLSVKYILEKLNIKYYSFIDFPKT